MKIKDIITITATFLGRDNLTEYFLNPSSNEDKNLLSQIDTLTRLSNIVISELAGGYIPMVKEETIHTKNGKIYYKDLAENFLEPIHVLDLSDNVCAYKQTEEYIETCLDKCKITYKYLPSNYGLEDEIGYSENQISACVLAYGVCAEFCLTEKNFDESVMWHDRFVQSVAQKIKPKNSFVKARRFI